MDEYIERAAIIPALEDYYEPIDPNFPMTLRLEQIAEAIKSLSPAEVAEVRYGRWEEVDWVELDVHGLETTRIPKAGLRCSRCSNVFKKKLLWKDNYCPNCGACMDKEDEHEAD